MGYVITLQCVSVLLWDGEMWVMQWLYKCKVFNTPWISYVGECVSTWTSVFVSVCEHVRECVCVYARVSVCVSSCAWVRVRECLSVCEYVNECVRECVSMCVSVCVCARQCVREFVCVSAWAFVSMWASVFVSVCECVSVLSPSYNYERLSVFRSISDVVCTLYIYVHYKCDVCG